MDIVIKQSEQVLKERILLAIAEHEEKIKPFHVGECTMQTITMRTDCGTRVNRDLIVSYHIPDNAL